MHLIPRDTLRFVILLTPVKFDELTKLINFYRAAYPSVKCNRVKNPINVFNAAYWNLSVRYYKFKLDYLPGLAQFRGKIIPVYKTKITPRPQVYLRIRIYQLDEKCNLIEVYEVNRRRLLYLFTHPANINLLFKVIIAAIINLFSYRSLKTSNDDIISRVNLGIELIS